MRRYSNRSDLLEQLRNVCYWLFWASEDAGWLSQSTSLSEVPCACILPTPGSEVTHEALVAFCRGQLASFKIPQYTVIMEGFPMTSSGKVQKFKLREMATVSLGLDQPPTALPTWGCLGEGEGVS